MEEGILIESKVPMRWIASQPETSLLGGIKGRGKAHRHVQSYRCVDCGYLESYARDSIK